MSSPSFLSNLPVHDPSSFSQLETSPSVRLAQSTPAQMHNSQASIKKTRATRYVPTDDFPEEKSQVIVNETRNLLLRHLHDQWDKKSLKEAGQNNKTGKSKKREANGTADSGAILRKRPRRSNDRS